MKNKTKWLINVPVATVWTSFDSARELDRPAVSNPANISGWLDSLIYETRLELCNLNLVQTQLLFGEEVLVLEEKEDYCHIIAIEQASKKDRRGYPGWVPKCQVIEAEDWKLEDVPVTVVTRNFATLFHTEKKPLLELSFQTILPLLDSEEEYAHVKLPNGESGLLHIDAVTVYESKRKIEKKSGMDIIETAEKFLKLPYVWGGMSSYGYDCSGFSYTMCKANGYLIPRDASDQAKQGANVPLDAIQPGDLLFFAYEEGKGSIHHVGIYCGGGRMIHSPNTGKEIEVILLKNTIYEQELCAARRYWQKDGE